MSRAGSPASPVRLLAHDPLGVSLELQHLPPENVLVGSPTVSSRQLASLEACEVGLWEMTDGSVTDVEEDEVFVVLSGRGTVHFADDTIISLTPGVIVNLHKGDHTTWTIEQTLRKVYVVAG